MALLLACLFIANLFVAHTSTASNFSYYITGDTTEDAIRFCSNLTVNGVVRGAEPFLIVAGNGTANGHARLVVMSSQVVHALAEHVLLSSTITARAIAELTQQFGWNRVTVVADLDDRFFLLTAEKYFKIANLSSGSSLLQLRNSKSEFEGFMDKVDQLKLRIIVLSLRSHLVSEVLCRARERHLMWPEYAWIVHSIEVSEEICGDNSKLDGVITVHLNDTYTHGLMRYHHPTSENRSMHIPVYHIFCSVSISQPAVIIRQIGKQPSSENEIGLVRSSPYPSDLPPQYVATVYLALFYTATTACFILCTIMLVLYICFRNEPAVKATSVSLSIMIFIGCYLMMLYLLILNSYYRLPSLHRHSTELRNCLCAFFPLLSGISFPMALILSTLLVKLVRVYWLFKIKRRARGLATSNLALASCVLLITAPNVLVSLVWIISDPFTTTVSFSIKNGLLFVIVHCVSTHTLRWTFLLLFYMVVLSLVLVVFATLTRNIKYDDFKDTKKISILSFLLVFSCTTGLSYWLLLMIIGGDEILWLHIIHYCIILECQFFVFAPKLFPVAKEVLLNWYSRVSSVPATKTVDTNTHY